MRVRAFCTDCKTEWRADVRRGELLFCPGCREIVFVKTAEETRADRMHRFITGYVMRAYMDYMRDDDASGHSE